MGPAPKRGRPTILPDRPLTNAEHQARWRARHPKPPKPEPDEPEFPQLKTFAELAGDLLPVHQPEKPPVPVFDPEVLIAGTVFI
jgi:hypothetical protein